MKRLPLLLILASALACQSTTHSASEPPSPRGRFEQDAGWVALFDGHSSAGWRAIGQDEFPESGWDVDEGCLHHTAGAGGGDIVSATTFGDFELEFEWKVGPGANSGVKYRVRDQPGQRSAFGPEYQILDDTQHANGQIAKTSAGALYDVMAVQKSEAPTAGVFHRARIVARAGHIEHWLDGERLFSAQLDSEEWNAAVAGSKFKGRDDFASAGPGRIALQDHGDEVWYRNLRLRELPGPAEREHELHDGHSTDLWRTYGDASYTVDDGSILGKVTGGAQSFLISRETYGDFIFEVDVKTEEPGNSGIQIRSHERENGQPFGYQIEIDPSKRSWTGGLYDEARRGWLANLEDNDAGRAAFVYQEWNHFRIETNGPWIKVRVNGIPTADTFDSMDLEGFFGLQVHSGNNTRVRWREPRLWDFGQRDWLPIVIGDELVSGPWAWTARSADTLELETLESTKAARRFPVVKFEMKAISGALHVHLQGDANATDCGDSMATPGSDGWCVQPALSATYTPDEWNEVSIGFDATSCALQVNGRAQRVLRTDAGRNGARLTLVVVGEDAALEVREVRLLGEPRPR